MSDLIRVLVALVFSLLLSTCTVYSSAGRKDFETKAPAYVKTLAFEGCDPIEQKDFDDGIMDSFLARSFYSTDDFWVAEDLTDSRPSVQVMDHKKERVCSYQFSTTTEWQAAKADFLLNLP